MATGLVVQPGIHRWALSCRYQTGFAFNVGLQIVAAIWFAELGSPRACEGWAAASGVQHVAENSSSLVQQMPAEGCAGTSIERGLLCPSSSDYSWAPLIHDECLLFLVRWPAVTLCECSGCTTSNRRCCTWAMGSFMLISATQVEGATNDCSWPVAPETTKCGQNVSGLFEHPLPPEVLQFSTYSPRPRCRCEDEANFAFMPDKPRPGRMIAASSSADLISLISSG
jgi:hypothetical protein